MQTSPSVSSPQVLERDSFFIREHVGMLKLTDTYDILDPETKAKIGEAREEVSDAMKFLRLLINKSLLPTKVAVYEMQGEKRTLLFSIKRGMTFFVSKVQIVSADGVVVGNFKSKLFSLGGGFHILDTAGVKVGEVKGDWKGWNFRILSGETELGVVTKKWAGLGKELFTSADNYMVSLRPGASPAMRTLLLAAGLAIDIVFKERK